MGLFRRPIRSQADGTFVFDIPSDTKHFIADLGEQLAGVLGHDAPALRRLFPTAYPDDPDRDAGYQALARGELIDQRHDSIATVRATVEAQRLTGDQLEAWMRVVNDLRLVLGTQLDVSEAGPDIDEDHPDQDTQHLYHVLGVVLEEIVRALSGRLPRGGGKG
jgi:hypothetical protein